MWLEIINYNGQFLEFNMQNARQFLHSVSECLFAECQEGSFKLARTVIYENQ